MNESKFLIVWDEFTRHLQKIDHILAPARRAILSQVRQPHNLMWANVDLSGINGQVYQVVFSGTYHSDNRQDAMTFIIPLKTCLNGELAVLDFLAEQKRQQEAEAAKVGELREERERDDRFRMYIKLKSEFEPEKATEIVLADASK
ncbi:MAG: hypothetical protein WA766_11490 [Candidatus Acidiferrales bacterium]